MIALKYINSENKEVKFLIHKKIITGFLIANGFIEIGFTASPAIIKENKPSVYNWSFKVLVEQIINFTEVETFLKSIEKPKINPNDVQSQIKFFYE